MCTLYFSMERQKYYKHQTKAKIHSSKYLSIIIDGMDQSKTQIPHFVHASKFTSSMWRLRVHLVGVILHGIGVYGFRSFWIQPLNQCNIICSFEHILYAQRISTWCIILTNRKIAQGKIKTGIHDKHNTNH